MTNINNGTVQPSKPAPNKGAVAAVKALFTLIVLGFVVYMFYGGGVEDKVAQDAIDQYNIVKESGSATEQCVHAGLVSAAFVQAKDHDNYVKWRRIEGDDCARAGVPMP